MTRPDEGSLDRDHEGSQPIEERLKAALAEFRKTWFEGKAPNVEAFCEGHTECGPELRQAIDDFIFVAESLPTEKADLGDSKEGDTKNFDSPADRVLGDFRIIREIGRGGMGTVYEAEQISLKRKVALKLLAPHLTFSKEAVLKFKREAEACARQHHPGIVAVHAVGKQGEVHYIAQELIEGGLTLSVKLDEYRKSGVQPQGYFRDVAKLFTEIADALQHAHDTNVIHRDIKPSNILLTIDGKPKITDFGLAKVEDALELSRTGDFAGTPSYMSPEQVMTRRIGIDSRTDIYSLGVTLYEMLTLKRPFEGKTSIEVLKMVMLTDPVDPQKVNGKVPRDLSTICLKAIKKLPERRYQTMAEFADDLQRFLTGDVILAKPAGLGTRFWMGVKRNPVISAAAGVAFLAALAFLGYVLLWSYPQIKLERDRSVKAKQDAEAEKNRAIAAEKLAEERAELIQKNSDLNLVYRLKAEAEELWPAYPWKRRDLMGWLDEARALLTRGEQYQLEFNRLDITEQIDPRSVASIDLLERLNLEIDSLGNESSGLIMDVGKRFHFAETVHEESIGKYRKEWEEIIASMADELECPKYKGLVIEPILGFVPIGRDPASGLWEFAHLQTGEIPFRDMEGKLFLQEQSCMIFVLIPGGTFDMGAAKPSDDHPIGSPNVDPQAETDEGPVRAVTLKPFLLSKYEMTQGQWLRFTGHNPSYFNEENYQSNLNKNGNPHSLLQPVENVNWEDCQSILYNLNLRLPSETEWEYAARAGTSTPWWTGTEKDTLEGAANIADLFFYKSENIRPFEPWLDDGHVAPSPVGTYKPNAFGLHDVHGNLWEWCQDSYLEYVSDHADNSARESTRSSYKIRRGGSWAHTADICRITNRWGNNSTERTHFLGLRPAADLLKYRDR